jgi:N-acetylated-alpha-linked acidic dipeptidase
MKQLAHAVAYFNMDVGVSGTSFATSAVPSLKEFVREVTREVPSAKGGTVYKQWDLDQKNDQRHNEARALSLFHNEKDLEAVDAVHIGTLGSGSDYTPFLQHAGVPATDIGSDGPYGVYHSAFDDYNWFVKFADPTFAYLQQQARVFGLEVLHMADADVLPYDFQLYGREIERYLDAVEKRATTDKLDLHFAAADVAAHRFAAAGNAVHERQAAGGLNNATLNHALRNAETGLLNDAGLPNRPWYKHTIYAPGEYTGYEAVVLPGVNEGIDAHDAARTQTELDALAAALDRASASLESATR